MIIQLAQTSSFLLLTFPLPYSSSSSSSPLPSPPLPSPFLCPLLFAAPRVASSSCVALRCARPRPDPTPRMPMIDAMVFRAPSPTFRPFLPFPSLASPRLAPSRPPPLPRSPDLENRECRRPRERGSEGARRRTKTDDAPPAAAAAAEARPGDAGRGGAGRGGAAAKLSLPSPYCSSAPPLLAPSSSSVPLPCDARPCPTSATHPDRQTN